MKKNFWTVILKEKNTTLLVIIILTIKIKNVVDLDISQVKLEDPDYQIYENLVSKTVDMYIFSTTIPPKTKQQIQYKELTTNLFIDGLEYLPRILEKLQFPIKFLYQKIQADLISYYQNKRYFN